MQHWYAHVVMPVLLGLLAVCLLGLGLRALITRRPYIFSARWLLACLLLSFAPNLLLPLVMPTSGEGEAWVAHGLLAWMGPALFLFVAGFFALQMRGYVAMAVTESSLREALLAALAVLRLPHEESLCAVRLPSVPGELQVVVQGWLGTGQLKARTRQSRRVLAEIIREMNRHFRTHAVGVNVVCPVAYIVIGLMLLAMDGALVSL